MPGAPEQPEDPILFPCSTDDECNIHFNSRNFKCIHNVCMLKPPMGPGPIRQIDDIDCKDDSDCPYGLHCIPEEKKCVPHGLTYSKRDVVEDVDCKDDSDCPYGLHCIPEERKCVPHGLEATNEIENVDCKDDRDCPYGLHCIPEEKKCVPHGL